MTQTTESKPEKVSKRGASLKLTERPKGKGEIIALGEEASRLLQSTVYNIACQSYLQHLMEAQIEEPDPVKREAIWHRAQALAAVNQELAGFVTEATRLSEEALRDEQANVVAMREAFGF